MRVYVGPSLYGDITNTIVRGSPLCDEHQHKYILIFTPSLCSFKTEVKDQRCMLITLSFIVPH